MSPVGRQMQNRKFGFYLLCTIFAALGTIIATSVAAAQVADRPWMNSKLSPEERADMVLKLLTLDEKLALLHGNGMAHAGQWQMPLTHLTNGGAGYVEGVPRLGIPPLVISDAGYGVRDSGANGRYSTAMPSSLGATSSWDVDSACEFGTVIGQELRAQGFNMTLGGGVDLAREPRNGRSFEYAGEDPLLAGTVVGNLMKCEQAQHVVGDIKHYVMNDQETGRFFVNAVISKRAMQESDLLAFHVAISIANPAAVMCSYNRINGDFGCQNSYTLRNVLEKEWGFKGFVISDWGGTHSTEKASAAGLDQEQPMAEFFGPKLKEAVESGKVPLSEIDDHARRILYAEFLSGIVDDPPQPGVVDVEKGFEVSQAIEEKSIVLLKNSPTVLHCYFGRTCRRWDDLRWRIGASRSARRQCHHASRQRSDDLAETRLVPNLSLEGASEETSERKDRFRSGNRSAVGCGPRQVCRSCDCLCIAVAGRRHGRAEPFASE